MGHYTHPTGRLPPDLRNIPLSSFLSLEILRNSLLINLGFIFVLLKWLISCSPSNSTRTAVVPDIMETVGLAGSGMARGVKNETCDTTMQLHRLL
ncbi:hypothetical protein EMIT0196MI5_260025 [Pseudomonas sp. IT-196MI5]